MDDLILDLRKPFLLVDRSWFTLMIPKFMMYFLHYSRDFCLLSPPLGREMGILGMGNSRGTVELRFNWEQLVPAF